MNNVFNVPYSVISKPKITFNIQIKKLVKLINRHYSPLQEIQYLFNLSIMKVLLSLDISEPFPVIKGQIIGKFNFFFFRFHGKNFPVS